MANLRIISDNAADRATLTASTTSGLLVAANLLSDKKSSVWRATGTSAILTGAYTNSESAAGLAIPFCNLSPTATIRVRLYSDTAGTALVLDTGTVLACPAPAIVLRGWTAAQSASAYAYGGGATARIWFALTSFKKFVVDVVDANNLQGYIEAARLVCGPYWEPTYNTKSLSETYVDGATHYRTDAGDLLTDAGTIHKKVPIEFEFLPASDRALLADILRASRAYPIFLSVFPGNADLLLERAHTVYGKRMSDSELAVQMAITYGTKIEVESI
jgi:hypothetical protein